MHRHLLLLLLGTALAFSLPARAEDAHAQADDPHAHGADPGLHGHAASPWEFRVGVEAPFFDHASVGGESVTNHIGNTFEAQLGVLVGYQLIPHTLALELEVAQGALFAGREDGLPKRTGTVVRPGVSYTFLQAPLPVYGVFMLPMHLEPDFFLLQMRVGAGTLFKLPFPQAQLFVEADLDFALAGGDGTPSAFGQQTFSLAAGLLFHL
jgi:hypothetical protein